MIKVLMKKLLLKKNIFIFGLLFFTAFFSVSSFANQQGFFSMPTTTNLVSNDSGTDADLFKVSKYDVSINLLAKTFGRVEGLFRDNEGQPVKKALLNEIFKHVNQAIMFLVVFMFGWATIGIVLRMAGRGEFLDRKHTPWTVVRIVIGIGTCVPLASGYTALQFMMMWVVIQGVGLADTTWNTILTYLGKSDSYLLSYNDGSGMNKLMVGISGNTNVAAKMLKSLVCANVEADTMKSGSTFSGPDVRVGNGIIFYRFDTKINGSYPTTAASCGSVIITDPNSVSDANKKKLLQAHRDGIDGMIGVLNNTAKNIVKVANGKAEPKEFAGETLNSVKVATDFYNKTMLDAQKKIEQEQPKGDNPYKIFWDGLKSYGWINAGAYYFDIAQQNAYASGLSVSGVLSELFTPDKGKGGLDDKFAVTGPAELSILNEKYAVGYTAQENPNTYLKIITDDASGVDQWASGSDQMARSMLLPIEQAWNLLGNFDPIIALSILGNITFVVATNIWGFLMTGLLGAAVAGTVVSYFIPGITMVYNWLVLFISPIFALLVGLFSSSVIMAIYIPLIPYMIFTFGAIGWLISVLEAMVAAPLVTIGLLDLHGQHEVFGRAEPAVQSLANVFLRPALMIIGLLGGMIISKVAVGLLSSTYGHITTAISRASITNIKLLYPGAFDSLAQTPTFNSILNILNGVFGFIVYVIFFLGFLFMFLLLVTAIINRSYSLIHMFPDRVLTWLGMQARFGEYARSPEQEVKQGFKQNVDQVGGMGKTGGDTMKQSADRSASDGAQKGRQARFWQVSGSGSHIKYFLTGNRPDGDGGGSIV